MDIVQALILGIIQGISEFVPISSSGHLVLAPWLLAWPEPGLAFDTVVHLGTLVAVLAFFGRDFVAILRGWLASVVHRRLVNDDARLGWLIIIATIPAAVAGFVLGDVFEAMFTSPVLVAVFLLITAVMLLTAEWLGQRNREARVVGFAGALVIGIAQAFAICPGISRSGATIAAGMALGFTRQGSARFSFLISAPIILGAAASQLYELVKVGGAGDMVGVLVVGFLSSAIVGYVCIGWLMRYLQGRGLHVFAAYCAIVGVATLTLALVNG